MIYLRIHSGDLKPPIQSLEEYFRDGGVSIIRAAFAHSYFVHPDQVRARTPYYPERARRSREQYPGLEKGMWTVWPGDGRDVRLDDNQRAQMAWERYTGSRLERGSGYSVRHIWGEPWNPDAFTAGWNLCYMPFWAGMLTEAQHPYPELEQAIRQASWELFFSTDPVCEPPDFVADTGIDLSSVLGGQPLLILAREKTRGTWRSQKPKSKSRSTQDGTVQSVREIRSQSHQSWSNIRKAARELQGLDHEPFGTTNVASSAKSCVRKIALETGLTYEQIEAILDEQGW